MTSQPEKVVKFSIQRFNPETKKRYISTFEVPVRKGMTILNGLMYIKDNFDESLAFRASCRMGICGSCGITVNGKPTLACYTQILHIDSDTLLLEPLSNMPVIKDLVVDLQPFFSNYKRIEPVLIKPEEASRKPCEFTQAPKDLKEYWDFSLCTKCSICYSVCPAAIDEQFLGPSTYATNYRFISDSRDEGLDSRLRTMADNVWLCTSCNSCTMFCPKEVDSSSSIVEERSLLVETGSIPRTVKDVLTSVIRYHNPLGLHPSKRMDWAKDLNVNTFPSVEKADVLFFVGCAPSYDPRSQDIARAMVSILNSLDVDFATLGTEERCCGDHILRLGEKGLFEMLAEHNMLMFKKFRATRIVTVSPHCYNTFRNDEPYVGLGLDVQHYTQSLAEASLNGSVKPTKRLKMRITYHDPCYLGKRNNIYEAPRQLLRAIDGLKLIEMARNRENSFCCGGGAGRTWTEDAVPEKRPNVNRVEEALRLGVDAIVTSCPFCVTTLEDAVKVLDVEDKIVVRDVLELLKEAI